MSLNSRRWWRADLYARIRDWNPPRRDAGVLTLGGGLGKNASETLATTQGESEGRNGAAWREKKGKWEKNSRRELMPVGTNAGERRGRAGRRSEQGGTVGAEPRARGRFKVRGWEADGFGAPGPPDCSAEPQHSGAKSHTHSFAPHLFLCVYFRSLLYCLFPRGCLVWFSSEFFFP